MSKITMPSNPRLTRELAREGTFNIQTGGMNPGYVQANLVILPMDYAFDFLLFCECNPKPCPLIEVVESGLFEPVESGKGADLRSDLPSYRIYRHGVLDCELGNISEYWCDDLVALTAGFTVIPLLNLPIISDLVSWNTAAVDYRYSTYGTAISLWLTSPIWGTGLAQPVFYVHNTFMQVAVRSGVLGLIPLVLIIANGFLSPIRVSNKLDIHETKLIVAVGAALFGLLPALMFFEIEVYKELWVVVALATSARAVATKTRATSLLPAKDATLGSRLSR